MYMSKLCFTTKKSVHVKFVFTTKHTPCVNIMLYNQTHCISNHYNIPPNTHYMSLLCNTMKQTVHIKVMPYKLTHCTCHNYVIPPNKMYI